jgi:hypothetical protein
VQQRHRRLGLLGDVQEAESIGAVRVDHRVQVDTTDPLEDADHRQQSCRSVP